MTLGETPGDEWGTGEISRLQGKGEGEKGRWQVTSGQGGIHQRH